MADYSKSTQARLDMLRSVDSPAYTQLTILQPFTLSEADMVAQLDIYEKENGVLDNCDRCNKPAVLQRIGEYGYDFLCPACIVLPVAVLAPVANMQPVNLLLEYYKDDAIASAMVRALGVIVLDPRISEFLKDTDPQALLQAASALAVSLPVRCAGCSHSADLHAVLGGCTLCACELSRARAKQPGPVADPAAPVLIPNLAVTSPVGSLAVSLTFEPNNFNPLLSPDGTQQVMPCDVCNRAHWVAANVCAFVCHSCVTRQEQS